LFAIASHGPVLVLFFSLVSDVQQGYQPPQNVPGRYGLFALCRLHAQTQILGADHVCHQQEPACQKNAHVCIGLAAYDRAEMLVIFRDSEQEPEQELDPTSLDDHLARSGAAWLLQRFSGSDSVLAMRGAFSGFNKDKPEKPHSLNKEALGGADAQQASSAARMSISARFRASALGRSSGTAVE